MLHLLLLRHGLTDSNVGGVLQGHLPTSLNATGHRQAALLAERLQTFMPRVEALVSSDLPRALETAAPIARSLELDVRVEPLWRERSFGSFEGRTVGEADVWRAASGSIDLPGAEPLGAFHDRVARALGSTIELRGESRVVAVVTHGGPIRAVMQLMRSGRLPLPADHPPPDLVPIENCSILSVTVSGEASDSRVWRLTCVNDIAHLAVFGSDMLKTDHG